MAKRNVDVPKPIERRTPEKKREQQDQLLRALVSRAGQTFTHAQAARLVGRRNDGTFRTDLAQVRKMARNDLDILIPYCVKDKGGDEYTFDVLEPESENGRAMRPLKSGIAQVRQRIKNLGETARWVERHAESPADRAGAAVTAYGCDAFEGILGTVNTFNTKVHHAQEKLRAEMHGPQVPEQREHDPVNH